MNRRIDNQPVDVDAVGVLGPRHRSDQTTAIVEGTEPTQARRTKLLDLFMQRRDAVISNQRRLHPVGGALNGEEPPRRR
ncbi:hypothetical protein ACFY2Y_16290 [Janibacter hoylei]|uniref:hypothetical protein n=1 Tax=Janibacter hoylei TaxID=364298 RepID=UPI00082B4FBB